MRMPINGQPSHIGAPLPKSITSFSMDRPLGIGVVGQYQLQQIRSWIASLISRLGCDHIQYGNTILRVSDFKEQ